MSHNYLYLLQHMSIDFKHNTNGQKMSHGYIDLLLNEWYPLDPESKNYITLSDYITISARMVERGIPSWELTDPELLLLAHEFRADGTISFRQFCLYGEHEELYDEGENAIRIVSPSRYEEAYAPQRVLAYDAESDCYEGYRDRCFWQLYLDLDTFQYDDVEIGSVDKAERLVRGFEAEDVGLTGFVDRDAFLRILYSLASSFEGTPTASWTGEFQQPSLSLLQRAVSALCGDRSCSNPNSIFEATVDRLEAMIRIDSEFSGDVSCVFAGRDVPSASAHPTIPRASASQNEARDYRVSLRQFCTFVERPSRDYPRFPHHAFTMWMTYHAWTPVLHRVLGRYWKDTVFQKQVWTLLLVHRGSGREFGALSVDVLYDIIAFLPRDLRKAASVISYPGA